LVEQFRNLAASLNRMQRERSLKSLAVTSPAPGDGKSHVAVNLALTLSHSFRRRVLLIDADLRRPTLHTSFGVTGRPGLREALQSGESATLPLVAVSETLSLLPAGEPLANPVGELASGHMARLAMSTASRFDWVIIDTPPAAGLADARIVSETVDGVILVVRAGVTRFPELETSIEALGAERVLGVVFNAADPSEIQRSDYYSGYYGDGY
ncbi:MAG TPA: CpsD/CapB family tyrosine-protein kinase, partial [Luteitalea sp.]|nr:CpsD/CapB family tyrosine-protein kinase [Luteitalea sp.]